MDSPTELLTEIADSIDRAQALVFVVPEDTGFFSAQSRLTEQVQGIIEEALLLMQRVTSHYDEVGARATDAPPEPEGDGREDDFLREIGAAISSELAAQEVSNIAFAVRAQLMETYAALKASIAGDQTWIVASHADTGLRRAGKGLISLESTIREYEDLEPVERTWSKVHDSIEIRSLYCQFRRGILRQGAPDSLGDLVAGLRRAGHRIAILRDRKIYPLMRISDRIPIRRLQKRIMTWLKQPDGEAKTESGRQLWGDLVSFAELLVQVNHREELREHDRRLIGDWLGRHFPPSQTSAGGSELADDEELRELESLIGCSEELDDLLLRPGSKTLGELRVPLERIFRQLNRPFQPKEEPVSPLL